MTDSKKNSDKNQRLGNDPIPGLVLRFSATTLVALLLNSLYTLTDALFVSWGVGDNAMGGISVVFPFVVLQGAVSSAVGSGAASIVSRKLGKNSPHQAGEVTLNAMVVFYSTAILTTLLGLLFLDPILSAMGVTEELFEHAKSYFLIILLGNVFSTGFSNIIRAEGKMLYGLMIWVIPITINIVLDAVFILAFKWGVTGSALATVICQFTSFCMSVLFFKRYSTQSFKGAKIRLKIIGEIISIGLPSLIQMGSLSIITALLNNILGSVSGTLGVNSFAYISKLVTFAIMPFTAVCQALAPIVGFNYGKSDNERVNKAVKFSLLISYIYAVLALLIIEFIPTHLMKIFTADNQIIELGGQGLQIISISLIFMPLSMLGGTLFQATGKKLMAFILYSANVVFMIPISLTLAKLNAINGVWWGYVAANALCSLIAAFSLLKHTKKKP